MDPAALFKQATELHQAGDLNAAAKLYDEVLAAVPNHPETRHLRGIVDLQQHRYREALAGFDAVIAAAPGHAAAHANRCAALLGLGKFPEALSAADRALVINPASAVSVGNRAAALNKLGRFEEGLAAAEQALAMNAKDAQFHLHRAEALIGLERPAEALDSCDRAAALNPFGADIFLTQAHALRRVEQVDRALAACDHALLLAPDHAATHANRAALLNDAGRHGEAIASSDRAIALKPDLAAAHAVRATALARFQRLPEAAASYARAVALDPNNAETQCSYGLSLNALGRWDEGAGACARAAALRPNYLEAIVGQAIALNALGRHGDALVVADVAAAQSPYSAQAHFVRAAALLALMRYDESLVASEVALALDPSLNFLAGNAIYLSKRFCKWDGIDGKITKLLARIDAGESASSPFSLLSIPSTPQQQRDATTMFFVENVPAPAPRPVPPLPAQSGGKIRLGYYSADFNQHATSHLITGLLETHDRARFEVIGFATGGPDDGMRKRVAGTLDRLLDVSAVSDAEAVAMSRALGIHIAVDLNGFITNRAPRLFAAGLAPLQVNYLSYPGTLGGECWDYIVGDPVVTPLAHRDHFSERIVSLPHCYQCNDFRPYTALRPVTRGEHGLPETGFVFCGFNGSFKISPEVFDIWMRLLAAVDGSVLWLLDDHPTAKRNLVSEAGKRGIAPERLIFAPRAPAAEHLARQAAADLLLDTFYYNAHTTASDALWAGLPLLTCRGETFASRVAASTLTAAGLPELITDSPEHYESLALALATQPSLLASFKKRLQRNRATCPLFDIPRFTRNIERAYLEMWKRFEAGEAPAEIVITDDARP